MKKIICLAFCMSLLFTSAIAFSDISDETTQTAVYSLNSLGIIDGYPNGTFNPNGDLTRGAFAKISVLALGDTNYNTYKSYTIFTDVKSDHWASGYINSAVRQFGIIGGYPDSSFKPENSITLGQSATILLRMLGYEQADIGDFWPQDYITKASSLGLLDNVSQTDANGNISRSDASIMLRNLLITNTKGGSTLLSSSFGAVVSDSILLATSETSSSLDSNTALFYENGETVTRSTINTLPKELIGTLGYVVFDETQTSKVLGFVAENTNNEVYTVSKAYSNKLVTDTTTLYPNNDTVVILGSEKLDYSSCWFDIMTNNEIRVYYSSTGDIESIVVTNVSYGSSYVYTDTNPIPSDYSVIKNSTTINASDISKYDVVTLDTTSKIAYVSDSSITAVYQNGNLSYSSPTSVTLLNETFDISNEASKYFADMKLGDKITLLFNVAGEVTAAYPASVVSADMYGYVNSISESSAEIRLLTAPVTFTMELASSTSEKYTSFANRVVRAVTTDELRLYSATTDSKNGINILDNTLDSKNISPNVYVFEGGGTNVPVYEIAYDDILSSVSKDDVIFYKTDSAGTVTIIVLDDVTGDAYNFGIATIGTEEIYVGSFDGKNFYNTVYTVSLRTATETIEYQTYSKPNFSGYVGIPKGYENLNFPIISSYKTLIAIDTIGLNDFYYYESVSTDDGVFTLADDIMCYNKSSKTYMTLRQAKANYTNFTIYVDDKDINTGKVRFIVVS